MIMTTAHGLALSAPLHRQQAWLAGGLLVCVAAMAAASPLAAASVLGGGLAMLAHMTYSIWRMARPARSVRRALLGYGAARLALAAALFAALFAVAPVPGAALAAALVMLLAQTFMQQALCLTRVY